jgi:AP-3 complex subunit mu
MIEDVAITIPFPNTVRTTADSCSVNMGSLVYDEAGKVVRWNIGKLDITKKPQLQGKFILDHPRSAAGSNSQQTQSESQSHTAAPNLSISWKIPLASVSGLSVSGLSITGEVYRPYKGVRNITKSGMFQVRGGG